MFENNQSVIVFCPRAGLSQQTQDSPLYPLLSLSFRIFIQSIYHNIFYHLTSSSVANFFPFTFPCRASFSRQLILSQRPSQFLFLFFMSSSIILRSPTLSSTTAFFILSDHFTRSILLHSTSLILPVVYAHSVVVSKSLHLTTLHSTQSTSLVSSVVLFLRARRKCLFSC